VEEETLVVNLNGAAGFICGVGQQLAWLGSVCRPVHDGLHYSDTTWSLSPEESTSDCPTFTITHRIVPVDKEETKLCWHSLLDSTIATGFPIPRRGVEDVGLQVSTEMMAALAGVSIAVNLGSGYLIKGETCAFYPKRRTGNHVVWHVIDKGDNYLEFQEVRLLPDQIHLTLDDIKTTTAFLAWNEDVINCSGLWKLLVLIKQYRG
jgi:hypothetical protein